MGCAGAWSLHPTQIAIAKRVFSPDPAEVAFAKKILDAMPDGTGAVMIDGKMQDDATWKQAKVVVDLAQAGRGQGSGHGRALRALSAGAIGARSTEIERMAVQIMTSMTKIKTRIAKFKIGQVVKHRIFPFRGVIFDIDPIFNNTEEWWLSIPAESAPAQGPAVLSPVRRERGDRIRRLCLGAEPAARQFGRADPPSAGRGRCS